MAWFLYLFGMTWIAAGSCWILYTHDTRKITHELLSKFNPKKMAVIAFAAGILMVLSAEASSQSVVIRIFGALAMIKGAFIFLNPENLYDKTIAWYLEELSDQAHRFVGIVIVILGTAVLSWIL